MIRHPDILSAAFLMVLGATMFYFSGGIHVTAGIATFNAQFFPKLMSAGIFACGVGLMFQALRAERKKLPFLFNKANFLVASLLCLYFLFFEDVDFRISTWALMLSCMWVLGARSVVQLVLTPIVTSLVMFWLFTRPFEVVLPTWI